MYNLKQFQKPFYPQAHISTKLSDTNEGNDLYKNQVRELEDFFSKLLNPMAQEFVPPSLAASDMDANGYGYGNRSPRGKKNVYDQGKKKIYNRTGMAQSQEIIRRTVFVSDIDHLVVDCRVCGDPRSVLRFGFVEFTNEEAARAALSLSGTVLGYYPVKVTPSKTAIAPVNPTFLPQTG